MDDDLMRVCVWMMMMVTPGVGKFECVCSSCSVVNARAVGETVDVTRTQVLFCETN